MARAVLIHLVVMWGAAAALMAALWWWARRVGNWAWVDVGWSASFSLGVACWLALGPRAEWPLAIAIIAWSSRLATHLARDRVIGKPEEGRYVELRRRWGRGGDGAAAFALFFQAQALLAAVLSIAMVVPFVAAPMPGARGALRWIALAVIALSVVGESLADAQLARWKRDPRHRGQVCEVGLWRYSRHPNYFFEWLIWVGFTLYALAFPWGAIAVIGPLVILASIWKVTGIPATEAQALRSRGDAYRRYQRTVSAFVPWPRRREVAP